MVLFSYKELMVTTIQPCLPLKTQNEGEGRSACEGEGAVLSFFAMVWCKKGSQTLPVRGRGQDEGSSADARHNSQIIPISLTCEKVIRAVFCCYNSCFFTSEKVLINKKKVWMQKQR